MKWKFLCLIILALGINTVGSSEECPSALRNQHSCNKEGGKNVTADRELDSEAGEFTLTPLVLLLQI